MGLIDFTIAPPPLQLRQSDPIAIYGAGNTGRMLAAALRGAGFAPQCFFDHRAAGPVAGIEVLRPDEFTGDRASLTVLVAVFSSPLSCDARHVVPALELLGYRRIITFEELVQSSAVAAGSSFFWLTAADFYRSFQAEIEQAATLFEDEESRALFAAQLNHRLGASWRTLPEPLGFEAQYFDGGLRIGADSVFFDIGAFDGDTLRQLQSRALHPRRVVAFEPDAENFRRLADWVAANPGFCSDVTLLMAGVGDRCRVERFAAELATSSHFGADGGVLVPILSLDEVFMHADGAGQIIKMDIEGAEEEALCGMAGLIRRNAPELAVSVYHRPQDLFKLPLLVKRLRPDYRLRLRNYGAHGFETVLYALR